MTSGCPTAIHLKLETPWQGKRIRDAIRKNGSNTKVSVNQEFPASLTEHHKALVQKGKDLIAQNKGSRFLVVMRGRHLVLRTKGPEDKFFTDA